MALVVLTINVFHILGLQFLYLKSIKDGIWVRKMVLKVRPLLLLV